VTAEHTVTVEADDDGTPYAFQFACTGGPDDVCHQWCAEGCDEECIGGGIILSAASVEPNAQAPLAGHRWEPMPPDGRSCRVVDWLDAAGAADTYADEDEPHRPGTHRIAEEWTGDDYMWSYADPVPAR
jgi:hypothetical protein